MFAFVIKKTNVFSSTNILTSVLTRHLSNIQVPVQQGTVSGLEGLLPNGNPYYSFKGIPYAKPPIGNLRFKDPVKLEKFAEPILNCTNERSCAHQKDLLTGKFVGSEDCLYLNVYTPSKGTIRGNNKPLPVMLWIHGGAFVSGSGNSDYYSPEYLVQNDVIIVTCNYRLGPFGFLCLPEAGVSGNAAMKDQLLVLKWVNENISQFGGDPNNVTLFGESAGGASIYLHLFAECSKPYFHKAICQSGVSLMEWSILQDPIGRTTKIAELLGHRSSKNQKEILTFLNTKSTQDIYEQILKSLSPDERRRGLPIPFKPFVEKDSSGAFLTKSVLDLANESNTVQIPVMLGYNNNEGIIMLEDSYKKLVSYDSDLARMIPRSLNVHPDQIDGTILASELKKLYFHGQKVDKHTLKELANLQTDYHFAIHTIMTAELHLRKQPNSPLHFYRFSYDGDYNFFKMALLAKLGLKNEQLPGACHTDEMFYLFNPQRLMRGKKRNIKSKSGEIAEKMCKLWTNYAKYADPTPKSDKFSFEWTPIKSIDENTREPIKIDYLEINDKFEMQQNPDQERIDFWRNQYIRWNGDFLKPNL